MDKFSYAIGLGIGQNLLSMGAQGINVEDFAQAIKDVLDRKETAISHNEAREIVNKYFEELETKLNAENIEKGKSFLEENAKRPGVVTLPSGLQYEVITEGYLWCEPSNQRMGGSTPADDRRCQMEAFYSFRTSLRSTTGRRNDPSPQHIDF